MSTLMDRFLDDEAGATAVEYGLIAALVSVAAIGALQAVGTSVAAVFSLVSSTLSSASVAGMASAP
jgi:pilus assembly protein Flp/PilA